MNTAKTHQVALHFCMAFMVLALCGQVLANFILNKFQPVLMVTNIGLPTPHYHKAPKKSSVIQVACVAILKIGLSN